MAKAETLRDNFDDNSLSASWNATNVDTAVTITETTGQIQIALPNASPRYGTLKSATTYDMTDSYIQSQLVNAGSQTNMDCSAVGITNGTDTAFWNVSGNTVLAHTFIGGVDTDRGTNFTYSATIHKFFRIEEKLGTTYFKWSTDGKGWSTHFSIATSSVFTMTAVTLQIQAGFFGAPGTTTIARFDNFNFVGRLYIPINKLRPHPFSPGLAR